MAEGGREEPMVHESGVACVPLSNVRGAFVLDELMVVGFLTLSSSCLGGSSSGLWRRTWANFSSKAFMMGDTVDGMNWQRRRKSALTGTGFSSTDQDKEAKTTAPAACR